MLKVRHKTEVSYCQTGYKVEQYIQSTLDKDKQPILIQDKLSKLLDEHGKIIKVTTKIYQYNDNTFAIYLVYEM